MLILIHNSPQVNGVGNAPPASVPCPKFVLQNSNILDFLLHVSIVLLILMTHLLRQLLCEARLRSVPSGTTDPCCEQDLHPSPKAPYFAA